MKIPDIVKTLQPVIEAFQQLGIDYYIGGSVASSTYGMPRATMDVDVVSDLWSEHVEHFVQLVEPTHYVSASLIREALQHHTPFNLIHLETMLKVDVFVLRPRSYDQQAFRRRRLDTLDEEGAVSFYLGAPEDILLHKLECYHSGNRTSEQQWKDIIGILEIQQNALDYSYLQEWAVHLELQDLLLLALKESGVERNN